MRLLVCEYVTGGGFCGLPVPPGLWREGDAMRRALVKDLAALRLSQVTALVEPRVADAGPGAQVICVRDPGELWRRLPELLGGFDRFWPIAPESDSALQRMTGIAAAAGRPVIGSGPETVALVASKRRTAAHLAAAGLPVVPTSRLDAKLPTGADGWVVKPDSGAGAEETWYLETRGALEAWIRDCPDPDRFVVQPYVEGSAASLSLLCQAGEAWVLACNSQVVSVQDGSFRYHGGVVGALEHRRALFQALASEIARALPGLWGYVGVDLIDRDEGPLILEVNPRLTTSYVALGRALGFNPAGLILELLKRKLSQMIRPIRIGVRPFKVGEDVV